MLDEHEGEASGRRERVPEQNTRMLDEKINAYWIRAERFSELTSAISPNRKRGRRASRRRARRTLSLQNSMLLNEQDR